MSYLVFDLEMTGDDPYWHDIIQIGACLYDKDWKELGRYLQNVYPENEEGFSKPSEEVHGLSWEELQSAPMLHEVLPAFENWIIETVSKRKNLQDFEKERILRQTKLCGQGVNTDLAFLKEAYRKEKQTWHFPYVALDLQQFWIFLSRCLQSNGYDDVPQSLSLKAIAGYFDLERESDLHNALEDAVLTGECLKKVLSYTKKLIVEEDED